MLNNLPQPGPVNHATGKSNPVVRIKHCRIEGQPLNMIMVPMAVEDQRFMPPIKGDMAKTGAAPDDACPSCATGRHNRTNALPVSNYATISS